jgi:putative inorganic carbon (hco3(-)) transporter
VFLYCLLLIVERFHEWPHLGEPLFMLGIVPLTIVKIVGLATVGAAVLAPAPPEAAPRLRSGLGLLFAIFAVVPVTATVVAGLPVPGESIAYLISLGLMLFATRRLLSTFPRLKAAIRTVVAVGAFSTLWSFKQYLLEGLPGGRGWGLSMDSNYEALTLIVMIPLALWVARCEESSMWRRVGIVSTVALVAAAILTESRGAIFGLGVIVLGELFGGRRTTGYRATVLAGIVLMLLLAPSSLWQRMASIQISGTALNGDAASSEVRWQVVISGLKMIRANPVFGVGLDLFKQLSTQYNPRLSGDDAHIAHNTYLQVAAEGGLTTLALFLALMALALWNCRTTRRITNERNLGDLASAFRIAVLAFAAAAFFLTANYMVFYWFLVFASENLREIAVSDSIASVKAPHYDSANRPVARVMYPSLTG